MVSVLMKELTEEELARRQMLLNNPELLKSLLDADKPPPRRQPRILPDLTQQPPSAE